MNIDQPATGVMWCVSDGKRRNPRLRVIAIPCVTVIVIVAVLVPGWTVDQRFALMACLVPVLVEVLRP